MADSAEEARQLQQVSIEADTPTSQFHSLPGFGQLPVRSAQRASDVGYSTPAMQRPSGFPSLTGHYASAPTANGQSRTRGTIQDSQVENSSRLAMSPGDAPLSPIIQQTQPVHQPDVQPLCEIISTSWGIPRNDFTLTFTANVQAHSSRQGGEGNKTTADIYEQFVTGYYSERNIATVLFSIEAFIVTNRTGKVQCDTNMYRADRRNSIKNLKKIAETAWPKHFQAQGIKMPKYDRERITLHVAQTHGPSLSMEVSCWQEVIMDRQYTDWFRDNVIRGRAPVIYASLRYDVEDPIDAGDLF